MKLFWCTIWLLAFPAIAQAEPYFPAQNVSPTLLDMPYAAGSAQWTQDVEQIIALQGHASPEDIRQANGEKAMRPGMVAKAAKLTRAGYPKLYALLDRVGETSKGVTQAAKAYWHAPRPYVADARIRTLVGEVNNPSYPSGHTTGSYVWAYVLGMVMPERSEEFIARAEAIAQHRVLAGVHYPHDIEAGRKLAIAIVDELKKNDAFQADLAQARQELAASPSVH